MLANETKTKIQELCARDEVRIVQTRVLSLTHGFGLGHATFGPFVLWLLCSAVLERQKRSEFEFGVVDLFLYSAVSLAATRCVMLPAD